MGAEVILISTRISCAITTRRRIYQDRSETDLELFTDLNSTPIKNLQVIKRTAGILEIEIDEKGALAIARRPRGTLV